MLTIFRIQKTILSILDICVQQTLNINARSRARGDVLFELLDDVIFLV